MSRSFTLVDSPSLDDLQVFLARAARVEEGSTRLVAGGGVLAVYTAVFYPVGLLDEAPTVLGLRTVAIVEREEFDVVVPLAALLERVRRAQQELAASPEPEGRTVRIALPMEVHTVTWAAISPPRGGWYPIPPLESAQLDAVARDGIAEVASAVPDAVGEQVVRKVRSEVWGRPIEGAEHVPAGAAFAALSLGFLGTETPGSGGGTVELYETGPWTRLTTPRGHVLVKRRAWTLAR